MKEIKESAFAQGSRLRSLAAWARPGPHVGHVEDRGGEQEAVAETISRLGIFQEDYRTVTPWQL